MFPLLPGEATPVEPRNGGTPGNHTIVMVFPSPVTFTGVTTNGGTATTTPAPNSAPVSEVTVNLTGVPNAQVVNVALSGVSSGGAPVTIGTAMKVLLGDTNIDGTVNSGDSQQTRTRSGQLVNKDIFRNDVNLDGTINSGDSFIVRRQSGTGGTIAR